MEKEPIEIEVEDNSDKLRLDKWLAIKQAISRTKVEFYIQAQRVLVNGVSMSKSYIPKTGDMIHIELLETPIPTIQAENIPLNIVYEDDDLIIINKPLGMVVHPAPGHYTGTLVNALLFHFQSLSKKNGNLRPGIVHRIDKDTTGLLVVAKHDLAHEFLAQQLVHHDMKRHYMALVQGVIDEPHGKIVARIGRSPIHRQMMAVTSDGKDATTHFSVKQRFKHYTLLDLALETGRTHQIRVHLNYIGHSIEGDPMYFKTKNQLFQRGQLLHAYQLVLTHPTSKKLMTFSAPLPEHFQSILTALT
jgi:23S rRNA pseudouridine1911/1915/1917 synthase